MNASMKEINKRAYFDGLRDSIPIGLGYLAVSFSLGIMARRVGLTPFQGFIASLLNNASAGEYAGFSMIEASATLLETAFIIFIANARYLLMSCSLSQRMSPELSLWHRIAVAFVLTDEFFGIAIARPGYINPYYSYGAISFATPCWAFGTMFGVIAGNVLPANVVSALSVALYGMFIAIIIPPAKKDKIIAGIIICCFALSYILNRLSVFDFMSSGTKTILLTVIISAVAAILFPRTSDEEASIDEA